MGLELNQRFQSRLQSTWLAPFAVGLVAAAIVLVVVWKLDCGSSASFRQQVRGDVLKELASVRASAEKAINKRLFLTLGLKTYVSVNPNLTEQDFADVSALLMQESEGIRSVTLIKDCTISDVYPRAGNEAAIGLNLLQHENQKAATEYAIKTGQPWLTGPVRLVQGGEAFIYRAPVYLTNPGGLPGGGDYWGMVSILIDKDVLVSEIMAGVPDNLNIAIRGRYEPGVAGAIFLGEQSIEATDPLVAEVSLPTGSWLLYGVRNSGWPTMAPDATGRWLAGIAFAMLVGALCFSVMQTTLRYREYSKRLETAKQDLQQSVMRYELVMDGASAGIWDWDVVGKRIHYSSRWKAMRGYDDVEIDSDEAEWFAGIHPEDEPRVLAAIRAHLAGTTPLFEEKYRVRCKDGSWIHLLDRGKAVRDAHGQAIRMAGSGIDITQLKRDEIELQMLNERLAVSNGKLENSNEALEQSNVDLQQFAYVASHDLKTPLRSIAGYAQFLQQDYEGQIDPQADNYISRIVEGANRMQQLINDLLSYCRVESRNAPLEPVCLNHVFDDVLELLHTDIDDANAIVTRDSLPEMVGDQGQISQLLQNLIGNGIKYRGEQPLRVHVSFEQQGAQSIISIKDNGIGIPTQYREKIFEIFRRLHTQKAYAGTGIGLAVCRRIVHRHGGQIWVESVDGKGSTFYFTFANPLKPPQAESFRVADIACEPNTLATSVSS